MKDSSVHNTAKSSPNPHRWWAMLGVGMGILMATIDNSIVNVSMPTLVEQLHTNFAMIQWVAVSYTLITASLMLGAARLGDMFGAKRLYMAGLALFTLGSLLCGSAMTAGWLIGFRAFQGLGAVFMQALGMAIVTAVFPPQERGRALGVIGGIVAIGLAMGPALGGILIGLVGWRFIFWVNVPLGLLAGVMVARFVPPSSPGVKGQRFDLLGAFLLFATLVCYALGMTTGQRWGFGEMHVVGLLVAAGFGVLVFIWVESRLRQPMLDLNMFRDSLFGLNLLMGLTAFMMLGGMIVMPFFLELVKGYSTEQTGLLMMVLPVSMGLVSPWAGNLSDRHGSRLISLVGLLVLAGGCLAVSTIHRDVSALGYILRVAPLGIGMGLFQAPNNSAVMGMAPKDRLGVVSGLLALTRTLGNTSGLPLMGAVFTAHVVSVAHLPAHSDVTGAPVDALVAGVSGTFRTAALMVLVPTVLAWLALIIDRRRKRAASKAGG